MAWDVNHLDVTLSRYTENEMNNEDVELAFKTFFEAFDKYDAARMLMWMICGKKDPNTKTFLIDWLARREEELAEIDRKRLADIRAKRIASERRKRENSLEMTEVELIEYEDGSIVEVVALSSQTPVYCKVVLRNKTSLIGWVKNVIQHGESIIFVQPSLEYCDTAAHIVFDFDKVLSIEPMEANHAS